MNPSTVFSHNLYGPLDHIERDFLLTMWAKSMPCSTKSVRVSCEDVDSVVKLLNPVNFYIGDKVAALTTPGDQPTLVMVEVSKLVTTVRALGREDLAENVISMIRESYPPAPSTIKWIYNAHGESIRLPISNDNLPRDEFYPQITGDLSTYYDNYLSSSSNILLLIGPPGTGKTSFIRGLIHHSGGDGLISYDPKILHDDDIFADFMKGSEKLMILEDADEFLASRKKGGNTIMHRFLNVGDGLVSSSKKKIVFSTNLPSVKDIDSALMRPGRCFDILHFRKLTPAEAQAVKSDYSDTEDISLAELMNGKFNITERGVGFNVTQ